MADKEASDVDTQIAMRGGLAGSTTSARAFGKTFVNATDAQRRQVLDDIAWPRKREPEMSHGVAFFNRFRDMTASGFFSSADGLEGPAVRGQRVQPRLGRLSAGRAGKARRQLVDVMKRSDPRRNDGRRSSRESASSAAASTRASTCRRSRRARRRRARRLEPEQEERRGGRGTCAHARRRRREGLRVDHRRWSPIRRSTRIWLCGPNQARIENVEEIVARIESGAGTLRGIACEKPLARNVAEAKKVARLVEERRTQHRLSREPALRAAGRNADSELIWARGAATTGRPYLARAAEEHSGPHMPWFWQGKLQGGGVLNDMMCHSALVVRHLLTKPGAPRSSMRPVRITAHIASLKWSRPEYAKQSAEDDGQRSGLPQAAVRGFCEHDDRVRDRRRPRADRRSDDVVELRRRRAAAVRRAARPRVLDVVEYARLRAQAFLQSRSARERRAKISSRSRTPRWA